MIENIILNELEKYKADIKKIVDIEYIDCITIFSNSEEDYKNLNNQLLNNNMLIDNMNSGNLYYLSDKIYTMYGELKFIKIRKYDKNYLNYRISADFIVKDYTAFKNSIKKPVVKKYDTFELIQFKNNNSIINIINLSANDEYKMIIDGK